MESVSGRSHLCPRPLHPPSLLLHPALLHHLLCGIGCNQQPVHQAWANQCSGRMFVMLQFQFHNQHPPQLPSPLQFPNQSLSPLKLLLSPVKAAPQPTIIRMSRPVGEAQSPISLPAGVRPGINIALVAAPASGADTVSTASMPSS